MTTPRISIATLVVASSLYLLGAPATAQMQPALLPPTPVVQAQPVPTPGPNGTPVTFKPVVSIGSPVPLQPQPIVTTVPTTSPDGRSENFASSREVFVVGDYLIQPKVYNELSHGQQSTRVNVAVRGAAEFNLGDIPFMVEGETRRYSYRHEDGVVTEAGAYRSSVSGRDLLDTDIDGRLGLKLLEPRIYIAGSFLDKRMGNQNIRVTGYGAGLEKLPDYGAPLGIYFSVYYFPNLSGQVSLGGLMGTPIQTLRYRVLTYQLGFTIDPGKSPIFIDLGAMGDRMTARGNAPSNQTHLAPYAGVGFFSH